MKLLMTITAAALMTGAGWGIGGDPQAVTRTIEIVMTDGMRFTPDRIEIRQGEMVKLVVRPAANQGNNV